jgi:bacillithiol biosynthesis cysteine-adding enzyme BshC
MNDTQSIDFSRLKHFENGFTKLFCDYINDFQKVKKYYRLDFRSLSSFRTLAEERRSSHPHRHILADVLKEQNLAFGTTEKTSTNIDLLRQDNTVAIVTGQQVGMLGGPMYTLYKTITAIKLAAYLREQLPEFNFVPVFWLEGEDHDFEEVNKFGVLNADSFPVKIEYTPRGKKSQKNFGAVGNMIMDDNLTVMIDELSKALMSTEFKNGLLENLRSFYFPSASLNTAFASYLNSLIGNEGLVFIDPNDSRLKRLVKPIFIKEIEEFPKVSQLVIQQSAELEEQYHAQIKTKVMNVFLFHQGGRYMLEPRENDFVLRGTRQYFQKAELLKLVEDSPECISPNVALRPVCQDTLLPTVAYIAGPSEVAYFAQLKKVYEYFGCPYPVIYPRASATIVEERQLKILDKFQVDLPELFDNPGKISKKVIDMVAEVKIDDMFTEASQHITDALNELKFGLNYIDPTLLGSLESAREKIESTVHVLKEKAAEAQQRKHEISLRQIQKVQNALLPSGNFQERELNVLYFMNKYGLDFPEWLKTELHFDKFQHQFLFR